MFKDKKSTSVPLGTSFHISTIAVSTLILSIALCQVCLASENDALTTSGRLLARNVIYSQAVWCGNDDVILNTEESGPILFSLSNGVQRKIAKNGNTSAINCSPDGKWLITVDTSSSRSDRDAAGHEDYSYGVYDFSRINLASGKKERFAIAHGGGYWSPDGTKILFLGKTPQLSIKQPAPQWEFYWSHDWPSGTGGVAAWMPDSQSLLLAHRDKFYLQRGQNLIPLDLLISPRTVMDGTQIKIDSLGNIYVSITDTKTFALMYQLFKCSIHSTQISCAKIDGSSGGVIAFDVSRDGRKLVYIDPDHSYLYLVDPATLKSKRIAERVQGIPSISPDGKNVVFDRQSESNYSDDAFILPLN